MTPKTTFKEVFAPAKTNKVEKVSTSTPVQDSSKKESRDLVRARIEFLLSWAERESLPTSLMKLQNN